MCTANTEPTVSHGDNYFQLWLGQLNTRSIGERSTMEAVQSMGIEKGVEKPRATNVAYYHYILCIEAHFLEGPIQSVEATIVGAARTKDRWTIRVKETNHVAPPQ